MIRMALTHTVRRGLAMSIHRHWMRGSVAEWRVGGGLEGAGEAAVELCGDGRVGGDGPEGALGPLGGPFALRGLLPLGGLCP